LEYVLPPAIRKFNAFTKDSVTERISLQKAQAEKPEAEQRQDLFHFLCEARNPDTGVPYYNESELLGESGLLIIAGSDTTSISLSGIFFYLTGDQWRYQKLVDEIRSTFSSAEDIVFGPKLQGCVYLKACVDEGMRLVPAGTCELPRQVLSGGIQIMGEHYPAGTIVGTAAWPTSRNQLVYGDPEVFRPERWIVDDSTGVTKEAVARARSNFHPFSTGPGACVGKNIAMAEILITTARTLYRLEVRRAPGSKFGGGSPELGWGARDPNQMQLRDAYVAVRQGPEVQFRKRA
jgi:cytochrome P450